MKKLFYLMAMAIVAVFASSCSNDDDDTKFVEKLGMYHIYNVTGKNNATTTYEPAFFTFELNHSKRTADITIKDVKFSPMMPAITMVLKEVPFTSSATGVKINAVNLVPEVDNKPMNEYTITSFNCRLTPSQITKLNTSMVSFVINNVFTINAFPIPTTFEHNSKATTTIPHSSNSNDEFVQEDASYAVYLDKESNLAQIYIYNIKFAEKMPAMNMIFPNVPFTATATGFELESEGFIPTLNNAEKTPVNNQPIRSFTATISNGNFTTSFFCNAFYVSANAFMFASESPVGK